MFFSDASKSSGKNDLDEMPVIQVLEVLMGSIYLTPKTIGHSVLYLYLCLNIMLLKNTSYLISERF